MENLKIKSFPRKLNNDIFKLKKKILIPNDFIDKFEEEFNSIASYMKIIGYKMEIYKNSSVDNDVLLQFYSDNTSKVLNICFYLNNSNYIQLMEFEKNKQGKESDYIIKLKYKNSKNFILKLKKYITEKF